MSILKATGPGAGEPNQPAPAPGKIPAFFRGTDWLAFLITFGAVWLGYYLTLAPELTLEDSGELATGSFYAGIPHPPGYPVWTIYTWLWTVLVPFKNIAWRVALGEATGGALAAGLLGLLVSRGSSLLMEGIEQLKAMGGRWENAICIVSGFVAGTLIGFNGFMWSQSVIVEVYAFSVASFMVTLLFLLRWIYAPHQHRYLYYGMFFFGICFTNHQTLIVAAMGLEVAIAAASFRMGRMFFLGNSVIYLAGLILKQQHLLTALDANPAIFTIFNVVGLGSIAAYVWFVFLTKEHFLELCRDGALAAFVIFAAYSTVMGFFGVVLALVALGLFIKWAWATRKLGWEWLVVIICGLCWIVGAAFYFYMPLAGMSNPPMQWGYPRTVEGFIHAFTRGQYEKTNPTDIIHDPFRFLTQLNMLGTGIVEEFNWVYVFVALVPFLFFFKMNRRERAWLIGIGAIYLCLGVLLLILLNPPPDRQAQELVRVFFGASHTLIAMLVGYGLTLVAAHMATHYQRFRSWGLIGGAVATALALFTFTELTTTTYFGEGASIDSGTLLSFAKTAFTDKYQFGLPIYAGVMLIGMTLLFLAGLLLYRNRAPLAITLGVFALIPFYSVMTHWSDNEQREHWFGYWFGHDMFTPPFKAADGKPIYPEMTKDAVLFGGTDPGRFCPTYMIFCDSFLEPKQQPVEDPEFDRRDVYIITQNALADGTYLCYIRAHYNRSQQIDPPFFQELMRSQQEREQNYRTNFLSSAVRPLDGFFTGLGDRIEKRRRTYTSWFKEEDFIDLRKFADRLRPNANRDAVSTFIYENLGADTRQLLAANQAPPGLAKALAGDLNKILDRELQVVAAIQAKKQEIDGLGESSKGNARRQQLEKEISELFKVRPLYDPARFALVKVSEYLADFIKENPQSHSRVRLNRLLLEAAYPAELAKTKGGVYPDREIYIPTAADSQDCFQQYLVDAQKRLQHDAQFPNEPKQIKPGEDVRLADGKVQVAGQVAVMAINGFLTKVIFDHNPKNEFFVEESFPLDWMYPHLTPFGIIMKINREPLNEMPEEAIRKDHEFWKQYSKRLTGDIVDYDTKIEDICKFVEQVYLRRNFKGFTGDRKFVRDDQAQKAFSKLRSSIAGVYAWRLGRAAPGSAEQQRMLKEADFAFRQAFAFCPYSPEAVFRYVNLLAGMQRYRDAWLIASTCLKLDPYNGAVLDLVNRLNEVKDSPVPAHATPMASASGVEQLEAAYRKNPADFQAGLNLAGTYLQMQNTGKALAILDAIREHPNAESAAFRALLQAYSSVNDTQRLEAILKKLETRAAGNQGDADALLGMAEANHLLHRDPQTTQVLDRILERSNLSPNQVLQVAQQFAVMGNYARLEATLEKLVQISPTAPEAWYDLAALRANLGKNKQSLEALTQAIELSQARLKRDPRNRDLVAEARKDPRFAQMRQTPEFQKIVPPQ